MVVYVTFLRDVARQKLLNSANVSRSYSQNNTGTVFFETRCMKALNGFYIDTKTDDLESLKALLATYVGRFLS